MGLMPGITRRRYRNNETALALQDMASDRAGLTGLAQTLARRIGRFLERQGLLERDAENSMRPDRRL